MEIKWHRWLGQWMTGEATYWMTQKIGSVNDWWSYLLHETEGWLGQWMTGDATYWMTQKFGSVNDRWSETPYWMTQKVGWVSEWPARLEVSLCMKIGNTCLVLKDTKLASRRLPIFVRPSTDWWKSNDTDGWVSEWPARLEVSLGVKV